MHAGDEHEYAEDVRSRLPRLHRAAYLVLGDGHRAEDAVQNALTTLYRRWSRRGQVAEGVGVSAEEMLRAYAAQEEIAPLRLQAETVLATARRRVRNRRAGLVVAAGFATALILAGVAIAVPGRHPDPAPVNPVPAPLICTAEPLPAPDGVDLRERVVVAIDPSGRYVVGRHASTSVEPGLLLWTDGVLSRPAAAAGFGPVAVNAAGVVIGGIRAGGHKAAAVFRAGTVTALPVPAGTVESAARTINARGDVVGTVGDGNAWRPVLWPATGGHVLLGTGDSTGDGTGTSTGDARQATADAVTDDGVVLGTVTTGLVKRPYRWTADGTATPLPGVAPDVSADVIATAGPWLAGTNGRVRDFTPAPPALREVYPGIPNAYARRNLTTGAADDLGAFAPRAVSTTGVLIGATDLYAGHPAVGHDGVVTPLPTLDPARAYLTWGSISADGHTAVGTLTPALTSSDPEPLGPYDLVRWTC